MISLVLKDLLNLQSYLKTIVVFVAFYTVLSFTMADVSFVAGMLIILFAMIPISSFSYDQQAKWDVFGQTLPVTRKQIVLGKYIVALIFIVLGFALSFVITFIATFFKNDTIDLMELFIGNGMIALTGLILLAIMLPLIYKFGVEKSRIMLMTIALVPTFGVIILANLGFTIPRDFNWQLVGYSVPALAAIGFVLSFTISTKIYCAKDF
ncbi:ABC-2 transporter permease [Solibacillus sp. FSL H8-0523]|uniref:ABC-2 transporter permease n=1 Tax=Solibacillus sp. FSL H8-0523 TaxID=2954511 RepID=UPI003100FE52